MMLNNMNFPRFAVILVLIAECLAAPLLLVDEPKDVVVQQGDNITLDCLFSDSAPKCYWSLNDEPIEIGGRYHLIGDNSTGNCTLRIHQVVLKYDAGVWTCSYPKDSYTNYAPRSRGSHVKVQVAGLTDVGSGDEPKALENVQADEQDILKEDDLVADRNSQTSKTRTEKENYKMESGSGDFEVLQLPSTRT